MKIFRIILLLIFINSSLCFSKINILNNFTLLDLAIKTNNDTLLIEANTAVLIAENGLTLKAKHIILSNESMLEIQGDKNIINLVSPAILELNNSILKIDGDSTIIKVLHIISNNSSLEILKNNAIIGKTGGITAAGAMDSAQFDNSILKIDGDGMIINAKLINLKSSLFEVNAENTVIKGGIMNLDSSQIIISHNYEHGALTSALEIAALNTINNSNIYLESDRAIVNISGGLTLNNSALYIAGDSAKFMCGGDFIAGNSKIEVSSFSTFGNNPNLAIAKSKKLELNESSLIISGENAKIGIGGVLLNSGEIVLRSSINTDADTVLYTNYITYQGNVNKPAKIKIDAGKISTDYICSGNDENNVIMYEQNAGKIKIPDIISGKNAVDRHFPPSDKALFYINNPNSTMNCSSGMIQIDTLLIDPLTSENPYSFYVNAAESNSKGINLSLKTRAKGQYYKVRSTVKIDSLTLNDSVSGKYTSAPKLQIDGNIKMNYLSLKSDSSARFIFSDSIFISDNFENRLAYDGINAMNKNSFIVFDGNNEQIVLSILDSIQFKNILIRNGKTVKMSSNIKNINITGELVLETGALYIANKTLTFDVDARVYKQSPVDMNKNSSLDSYTYLTSILQTAPGKVQYRAKFIDIMNNDYCFPITILDGENHKYLGAHITIFGNSDDIEYGVSPIISILPNNYPHANCVDDESYFSAYWSVEAKDMNIKNKHFSIDFYAENAEWFGDFDRLFPAADLHNKQSNPGESNHIYKNEANNLYIKLTNINKSEHLNSDWGLVFVAPANHTFFSRQSGDWTDKNTWTISNNHNGEALPFLSLFPENTTNMDSIIIGNGHIVNLNDNVFIKYLSVGNPNIQDDIGALNTKKNVVSGEEFLLNDGSMLYIGASDGIACTENIGNIQTNIRTFSSKANYVYNNNNTQYLGNGIPDTIAALIIDKQNEIILSKSTNIKDSLVINCGNLIMNNYSLNAMKYSQAIFKMNVNNSELHIGGDNSILSALNSYDEYMFNIQDYDNVASNFIVFDGDKEQMISDVPTNFYDKNKYYSYYDDEFYPSMNIANVGFPTIILKNGKKSINQNMCIFGDIIIHNNAELLINQDVTPLIPILKIYKNLINNGKIMNYGTMEIGF